LTNEGSSNSLASVLSFDGKVTQGASSAVMTAESGSDDSVAGTRNETKPSIPPQVDIDAFSAVALLQT
jgi:hypothetical protein